MIPPPSPGQFEGQEISLDSRMGIFITMNPGYAGRTELPESVKALFRPVVVIVPDLQQICEIMLFSEGFLMAKVRPMPPMAPCGSHSHASCLTAPHGSCAQACYPNSSLGLPQPGLAWSPSSCRCYLFKKCWARPTRGCMVASVHRCQLQAHGEICVWILHGVHFLRLVGRPFAQPQPAVPAGS